jgi:hypothetical protein
MLLDGKPAWPGDESYLRVINFRWKGDDGRHLIVSVNSSELPASVRLRVSIDRTCASDVVLRDWFSGTRMHLHRGQIFNPGLELNLDPWAFQCLKKSTLKRLFAPMQIGPSRRAYCRRIFQFKAANRLIDQRLLGVLCTLREKLSKRPSRSQACSQDLLGSTGHRLPNNRGWGVFGPPRELGSQCSMPSFLH